MIQLSNLLFPEVKRIMIDKKDEDIFKQIIENKGKVRNLHNKTITYKYISLLINLINRKWL